MRGDFQLSSANVPLNEPLNLPFNADLNEIGSECHIKRTQLLFATGIERGIHDRQVLKYQPLVTSRLIFLHSTTGSFTMKCAKVKAYITPKY